MVHISACSSRVQQPLGFFIVMDDNEMGQVKYVQLEAAAFLSNGDFQLMTATERGVYCTLIFYMLANDGKIKNDPKRIEQLANCDENFENVWKNVVKKFSDKNGYLRHKRVTKELAKAKKYLQSQRAAGVKGAKQRWAAHNEPNEVASGVEVANKSKVKRSKVKQSKDNIYSPTSEEFRLAKLLLDLILERKPDFKKPNLQDWAVHLDRIIHSDGRAPVAIEAVIRWCQQEDFWQNNILSTGKLRKQFDQLEMKKDERKTVSKRGGEHIREDKDSCAAIGNTPESFTR